MLFGLTTTQSSQYPQAGPKCVNYESMLGSREKALAMFSLFSVLNTHGQRVLFPVNVLKSQEADLLKLGRGAMAHACNAYFVG